MARIREPWEVWGGCEQRVETSELYGPPFATANWPPARECQCSLAPVIQFPSCRVICKAFFAPNSRGKGERDERGGEIRCMKGRRTYTEEEGEEEEAEEEYPDLGDNWAS